MLIGVRVHWSWYLKQNHVLILCQHRSLWGRRGVLKICMLKIIFDVAAVNYGMVCKRVSSSFTEKSSSFVFTGPRRKFSRLWIVSNAFFSCSILWENFPCYVVQFSDQAISGNIVPVESSSKAVTARQSRRKADNSTKDCAPEHWEHLFRGFGMSSIAVLGVIVCL